MRRKAAEYIDSPEFKEVMDNAEANSTQLKLRIQPDQVSEAKRLLEMTGDGSADAAWLDETALAVLALMEGWGVVVLKHANESTRYMTKAIPHMEFFPARFV